MVLRAQDVKIFEGRVIVGTRIISGLKNTYRNAFGVKQPLQQDSVPWCSSWILSSEISNQMRPFSWWWSGCSSAMSFGAFLILFESCGFAFCNRRTYRNFYQKYSRCRKHTSLVSRVDIIPESWSSMRARLAFCRFLMHRVLPRFAMHPVTEHRSSDLFTETEGLSVVPYQYV